MKRTPHVPTRLRPRNWPGIFVVLTVLGFVVLFSRCSMNVAGGNSSQTGNSSSVVSALSKTVSGRTSPGAAVSVFAQNFQPYATVPGFCDSTVADDSGRFAFNSLPQGRVNLWIRESHGEGTAFVASIPVFQDSAFAETVAVLAQPGFVSGSATDTNGARLSFSYVFVAGSPFYTVSKNNGDFLLGPIPVGRYSIGLFPYYKSEATGQLTPALAPLSRTGSVTVYPDSTSQWTW